PARPGAAEGGGRLRARRDRRRPRPRRGRRGDRAGRRRRHGRAGRGRFPRPRRHARARLRRRPRAGRTHHEQGLGRADAARRPGRRGRPRARLEAVRRGRHRRLGRQLPHAHRLPDQPHGDGRRRLPLHRLHARRPARGPHRPARHRRRLRGRLAVGAPASSFRRISQGARTLKPATRNPGAVASALARAYHPRLPPSRPSVPMAASDLYRTSHLKALEAEAVYVMREVAAQFERPVLLFSGGKDSIVMVHLARKAFHPAPIPFPLLHVDTGHNFPETMDFRDALVEKLGVRLYVASVQEAIDRGRVVEETGPEASRNGLQIVPLLDAIQEHRFDAAFGGGRRDEEKARAKERFFSHRDRFGQWDPKNQRPELWKLYNGHKNVGEHFRVFPLSNWTEMDVWQYIAHEGIEIPSLYFAHEREVFNRRGTLLAVTDFVTVMPGEVVE